MRLCTRVAILTIAAGLSQGCKTLGRKSGSDAKVLGGDRVVEAYPFMVGLSEEASKGTFFCGGTYLGQRIVLTAAHCVRDLTQSIYASIGVKSVDEAQRAPFVRVVGVVAHPDYGKVGDRDGDVALLFLDPAAANLSLDSGITLDQSSSDISEPLTVAGFGNISSIGTIIPGELRQTDQRAVPLASCKQTSSFFSGLSERQLCAVGAGDGGKDSCAGDSGGPLFARRDGKPVLVGVVSFGDGCGQRQKPGVYARVSALAPWITQTIEQHKQEPQVLRGGEPGDTLAKMIDKYCYVKAPLINQSVSSIGTVTIARLGRAVASYKAINDAAEFLAGKKDEDAKTWCQFQTTGGSKLAVDIVTSKPLLSSKLTQQFLLKRADAGAYLFDVAEETRYSFDKCKIAGPPVIYSADYMEGDRSFFVGTDAGVYKGEFTTQGANGLTDTLETCGSGGYDLKLFSSADQTLLTLRLKLGRGSTDLWAELIKVTDAPLVDATLVPRTDTRATFTLKNVTPVTLYTWELACPFEFALKGSDLKTYASRLGAAAQHTVRFEHQLTTLGKLDAGKELQFGMEAAAIATLMAEDSGCKVNGVSPVILN